ncbi:MAG: glycosyltransferase family 39 protein, partial [Patescibacteria group bacterium]
MKRLKKNLPYFILAGIIMSVSLALCVLSVMGDAVTNDESPHIFAGYSYLTQRDMRINPEHPTMIKDISAIPLLFQDINFDKNHPSWKNDINGQWSGGAHFLYESGNDPDKIAFSARMAVLFVFIALCFFVFWWGRKKYGNWGGFLALTLVALSPNIIAHARYVTTDIGAAFAFILGTFFFVKYVSKPTLSNLIIAGVAFGLAQLFKFSLFLLIPLYVFTFAGHIVAKNYSAWKEIGKNKKAKFLWTRFLKFAKPLVVIFVVGYLVIWPFYQYHVWNYPVERQKADTEYTMRSFPVRPLANGVVWMSDKPVLRAYAQYFEGLLMVFQRTGGGNTTYFMGEVSSTAWKTYFPIVYILKEPIPILILVFFSMILGLVSLIRNSIALGKFKKIWGGLLEWVSKNFAEFVWISFIALYWASSISGNLNIGVRHVLPTFPFIYLLVSGKVSDWIANKKGAFDKPSKTFILAILMILLVRETTSIFPNYLAYFNQIVGGPANGYKYVADSNLDWGQDLRRLAGFVEQNGIDKIKLDYFGGGSPTYYLGKKYQKMDAENVSLRHGWIAVSATLMQGGRAVASKGYDQNTTYYKWLDKYEPVAKIGYSIFVYK